MVTGRARGTTAPANTLAVGVFTAAAVALLLAGVLTSMQGVVAVATNEFYGRDASVAVPIRPHHLGLDRRCHRPDRRRQRCGLAVRGVLGPRPRNCHRRGQRDRELRLPYYPLSTVFIIAFDLFAQAVPWFASTFDQPVAEFRHLRGTRLWTV